MIKTNIQKGQQLTTTGVLYSPQMLHKSRRMCSLSQRCTNKITSFETQVLEFFQLFLDACSEQNRFLVWCQRSMKVGCSVRRTNKQRGSYFNYLSFFFFSILTNLCWSQNPRFRLSWPLSINTNTHCLSTLQKITSTAFLISALGAADNQPEPKLKEPKLLERWVTRWKSVKSHYNNELQ